MAAEAIPPAAARPAGAPPGSHGQQHPWRAAVWMLGALLSFSTMAVAGREISQELTTSQLMFYRSVFGFLIILAVAHATGQGLSRFRTLHLKLHVFRNLAHFVGQYGWFYAITLIPLAEVFSIEFTSPLWVAILAPFFLGERFTPLRALAVLLGFAGILVITRPGLESINHGTVAVMIAAVGFALTMIATKKLSASDSALSILFYMTLIQAPVGLALSLHDFRLPTGITWVWLVVVSFFGLSAHFCMANAYRHADVTLVAPMDYLRLPLIAVVGLLLYNEPMEVWLLLGGAMILGGNYLNIWARGRVR
jgi:drug/metabolite transporter (DMT)-like permease